ncbi:MAG: SDR family NAD(P)-dependent oxidoreductase [Brevinematia bacterium]
MTGIILGASGKIGKMLLKYIPQSRNLNFSHLILQSNSQEVEIPEEIENISTLIKCNFSNIDEINNFLGIIPNRVDILFNLVSIFEETPLHTQIDKIEEVLKVNFLNQVLLLEKLLPKLDGGRIIQFLDYCIFSPYTKRYFWYSISRIALFDFYRVLSKYFYENMDLIKILLIVPKIIQTEKDFSKITKIIEEFARKGKSFAIKIV